MAATLLRILALMALVMMPVGMTAAPAAAHEPHHAMVAMESGHCGDQPAKSQDNPSADKSGCAAMCTMIVVAPTTAIEPHALVSPADRPSPAQFHHGFLAKLPTPPPRLA